MFIHMYIRNQSFYFKKSPYLSFYVCVSVSSFCPPSLHAHPQSLSILLPAFPDSPSSASTAYPPIHPLHPLLPLPPSDEMPVKFSRHRNSNNN